MSPIFFSSTGGSLTKRAKPALAGNADGDQVALEVVAGQELLERFAGELVWVGVRLGEDFRMLDVIERRGRQDAVDDFQPQGFEGTLTYVDAPDPLMHWHDAITPREPMESGGLKSPDDRGRDVWLPIHIQTGATKQIHLL